MPHIVKKKGLLERYQEKVDKEEIAHQADIDAQTQKEQQIILSEFNKQGFNITPADFQEMTALQLVI